MRIGGSCSGLIGGFLMDSLHKGPNVWIFGSLLVILDSLFVTEATNFWAELESVSAGQCR